MRESLPSFFGFEAVGVLMYNFEQNQFFTDPDTSKDEQKESGEASGSEDENNDDEENSMMGSDMGTPMNMEKKAKKQKKKQKDPYAAKEEALNDDQKAQKIREIHSKEFMNFPTNSGISGAVFKSKELYFSNNASKETKFVEEIDNQSVCTDVKNFMIGPVFGSQDPNVPCAIIQFINKLDPQDKGTYGKIS